MDKNEAKTRNIFANTLMSLCSHKSSSSVNITSTGWFNKRSTIGSCCNDFWINLNSQLKGLWITLVGLFIGVYNVFIATKNNLRTTVTGERIINNPTSTPASSQPSDSHLQINYLKCQYYFPIYQFGIFVKTLYIICMIGAYFNICQLCPIQITFGYL